MIAMSETIIKNKNGIFLLIIIALTHLILTIREEELFQDHIIKKKKVLKVQKIVYLDKF